MARKMFEKAGLIPGLQVGVKTSQEPAVSTAELPRPKTAPGTMMGFLTAQSGVFQESESLKARIRSLEEEAPLRTLPPESIVPSRWANRHEASYQSSDFAELKAEIQSSGGNVQPIKVRPVKVLNGSTPSSTEKFELIYGHRRHRACLELGIPVLATVEEADDTSLFEQMERENRGRKNLSAWEQGTMYRKALDEGLYNSLRRLADSLAVDASLVSKSVSLARLPDAVVAAFASPLDIQFRWAAPLAEAMQKDPEGTLARAKAIAGDRKNLSATGIFQHLIDAAPVAKSLSPQVSMPITSKGKVTGKLSTDKQGRAVIQLNAGAIQNGDLDRLLKHIEDFLNS